jgi:hypothetical protein
MMREDQFPGFQATYRLLRKESIKFPPRDPNERMLMGTLGVDSPMFDFVEQISGQQVSTPTPGGSIAGNAQDRKRLQEQRELERQAKSLQQKDEIEDPD